MGDEIKGEILYHILKGPTTFSELESIVDMSSATLSKYLSILTYEGYLNLQTGSGKVKKIYSMNKGKEKEAKRLILYFLEEKVADMRQTVKILKEVRKMNNDLWKELVNRVGNSYVQQIVEGV